MSQDIKDRLLKLRDALTQTMKAVNLREADFNIVTLDINAMYVLALKGLAAEATPPEERRMLEDCRNALIAYSAASGINFPILVELEAFLSPLAMPTEKT